MELDPAIVEHLRTAIGIGLIHSGWADQDDDGEIDVFQWHHCFDQQACTGPGCRGCAGVPYLSDAIWNASDKFGYLAKAFELHETQVREKIAQEFLSRDDPETNPRYRATIIFTCERAAAIARGVQ